MVNPFNRASTVESEGLKVLLPYLKSKSLNGQFVTTEKGRLSKSIQMKYGDAIFNSKSNGQIYAIEFKVERENKHGNLFLETWSNLDYSRRNRGWMDKLDCDYLWYYFLESDELFIVDFPKLWDWAFCRSEINNYKEVKQKKYEQLNTTVGRIVPISTLRDAGIIVCERNPKTETQ